MSADYYDKMMRRQRRKRALRTIGKNRAAALAAGRLYAPRPATIAGAKKPNKGKKRFVGVDGEGGGTLPTGQQPYRLFRAGESYLFNNNKPLSTVECLNFILSWPKNRIYVGFGFGYDSTMILRDLPAAYVDRLFQPKPAGRSNYTYWGDFALDYRPGHYLRVARVGALNRDGVVPNSSRTIYETWGFFQSSFVKALDIWNIGDKAARAKMEKTKKKRGQFQKMTPAIIAYNGEECRWLAELMEKFRDRSVRADLVPKTWNGPGKTAAALLKRHNVIGRERVVQLLPPDVLGFACDAYYGGRAELAWIGILEGCWAYDIKSAYPAAMLEVPCIEHGEWQEVTGDDLSTLGEDDLFIADCDYTHLKGQIWCGLPHRATAGGLSWRRRGGGIYWSQEIFAAQRLGTIVKLNRAFRYCRRCNCQPLGFVRAIFDQRKALDRIEPGAGIPLKLAINSLYGKFAQRVGDAPYQNHLWAGFITASCRARVLDAILSARDPADIVMVATDGIYAKAQLPLDLGDDLGNWEEAAADLTLVFLKSGLYWEPRSAGLMKVRGMSPDAVREGRAKVEAAWADYARRINNSTHRAPDGSLIAPRPYPVVQLPMNSFVGLKLAHARDALDTAGSWTNDLATRPGGDPAANLRKLGFAWGTKRLDWFIADRIEGPGGLAVLTRPYDGTGQRSASWKPSKTSTQAKQSELNIAWHEGQPDYIEPDEDI